MVVAVRMYETRRPTASRIGVPTPRPVSLDLD
jgi:hypothetical protein